MRRRALSLPVVFTIFLPCLPISSAWGAVSLLTVDPGKNARLEGKVRTEVIVQSSSRATDVHLQLDDRPFPLMPFGADIWQGSADVTGIAYGPKILVFVATNQRGETARVELPAFRNNSPVVQGCLS